MSNADIYETMPCDLLACKCGILDFIMGFQIAFCELFVNVFLPFCVHCKFCGDLGLCSLYMFIHCNDENSSRSNVESNRETKRGSKENILRCFKQYLVILN